MAYRVFRWADDRIDELLLASARIHGVRATDRYHQLIVLGMQKVGENPLRPGGRAVPRVRGLRSFHLKLVRHLVAPQDRVADPRHLIIYRVASDRVVEILSVIHERMLVSAAARRARDASDG